MLGSGTSFPDPARGPAGFVVEVGERAWLVDGGSGTLQRCARAGVDPLTLSGGFYSHGHPDHLGDLVPLLFAFRVAGRAAPYPIRASAAVGATLDGLRGVFGRWLDFPGGAPFAPLATDRPDRVALDGLVVHTRPANHGAGALHLRFEADGVAVVFSGDTGPSDALIELTRGADLLVCECAGSDAEPVPGHLAPSEVAAIVRASAPGEVWLTHLYPHVDEALALATVARAGRPVRRAADLDRWTR